MRDETSRLTQRYTNAFTVDGVDGDRKRPGIAEKIAEATSMVDNKLENRPPTFKYRAPDVHEAGHVELSLDAFYRGQTC